MQPYTSSPSQMPLPSASAKQSPPHTPSASRTLPSQSHAPSGMPVHVPSSSVANGLKLHAVGSVHPATGPALPSEKVPDPLKSME